MAGSIEMQSANYFPPSPGMSPMGGGGDMQSVQIENNGVLQSPTSNVSKPHKQSGLGGASANLVNSIVGAGIIGIPYALRESGLVAGLFLLVLVSWLTDKSLRVIVGLASFHPKLKNRDVRTFEELASYPFGKLGNNFILLNMFVMAYGAMVAYLLIIKDTVPSIVGVPENARFERTLIMIATSITIMLPLSMQRDMASLAVTSVFSVFADVLLVGFIASYAPIEETVEEAGGLAEVLKKDSVNPTLFIGLGILSTAMACQHSAFIVSGSLENKTMNRWAKVTGFSITISAILCMILGVAGYLGFLEETQGDVLNNFEHDSFIANVARLLLAMTMFFTYPMESFVARHVMVQLVHNGDMDGKDLMPGGGAEGQEAGGFFCFNRRKTWTTAIYLLTLFPALLVDDLGPVLSITGSFGGGCIAYMGPGLCYIGVNGEEFLAWVRGLLGSRNGDIVTEADLPVEGNAGNVMTTADSLAGMKKPFWWYLLGFPIWTRIAIIGRDNMNKKIDSTYENESDSDTHDGDVMVPSRGEFLTAIFFVCFGVVSLIAGVGSNIYDQLGGDDEGEGYYN